MAGFTFVGSDTKGGESTTAATNVPHGLTISEGDLLVAIVHRNNEETTAISTEGAGGWTTAYDNEGNTAETHRFLVEYKVAGASEPTSYSWALNSATQKWAVLLLQYSCTGTATLDVAAQTNEDNVNNTTHEVSGITVADNSVAIAIAGFDNNGFTYSAPTNSYTLRATHTGYGTGVSDRMFTTGAATGDMAMTAGTPDVSFGIHLSFKDVASGTTIPVMAHHYTQNIG